MKKKALILIAFLLFTFLPFPSFSQQTDAKGEITFQPNIIPFVNITDRPLDKPESFRFEWKGNRFDIELFFNATYKNKTRLFSLRDFEKDFNVTVNYVAQKEEQFCRFGWIIEDVKNISDFVHSAWFKIEDTYPFDYEEIQIEEIELEDSYFVKWFILPDNLVLSFQDLRYKGFIIGKQNKTLTKIKGFKNKSEFNLDPIVFSSNIMTFTGTSSNVIWDFWNASHINGWNVSCQTCENASKGIGHVNTQFVFDCRLQIGDGSTPTTASDINKHIVFTNTSATSGQTIIDIKSNAGLRFGTLLDADKKLTGNGVNLLSLITGYQTWIKKHSNADLEFYSSTFRSSYFTSRIQLLSSSDHPAIIYNCLFDNWIVGDSGYTDFYRSNFKRAFFGLIYIQGEFDDILIYKATHGVQLNNNVTITNLKIRECSNSFRLGSLGTNVQFYLINPDVDNWNFATVGVQNWTLYRQYTFDLKVVFPNGTLIQNANVTISNSYLGSSNSWLTFANGSIPQQVYSYGHYNNTAGIGVKFYDYNPYCLNITYGSNWNYVANFTLEDKVEWIIALSDPVKPGKLPHLFVGFLLVAIMVCFVFFVALRIRNRND